KDLLVAAAIAVAPIAAACAAPESNDRVVVADATRIEYGTVVSVDIYRTREGETDRTGAVVGGVLGGVLGHQVGSGRGNTGATIGGALGGAAVGNEIEKERAQPVTRSRISVRLDSGATLAVDEAGDLNLRAGDRVRVVNDHIQRE